MKDDGGVVGLTECPAILQKWFFSGPEIACVIIEFERLVDRPLCRGPGVQKIFLEDVMSPTSAIGEYGNPFLKPVEKSDCNLFRDCMLHLSFSHKKQPCPPSLSVRGNLKLGTKSDIVRCLENAPEEQGDTMVDAVVSDGLAILYVLKPAATETFCES